VRYLLFLIPRRIKKTPILTIQGFTLTEIIVALLILSLVIGGVMASFVSTQRLISRSNRRLMATNYARQALELLRDGVNAVDWIDPNGTDKLDLKDWTNCVGVNTANLAAFGGACEYRVQAVLNDARRVDVRIRWQEP
jgi:prepilin-type N-terminal cleavage/methylation domain-containing protein